MHGAISLQAVLEVVGEFDACGGASVGLVAWELCIEEPQGERERLNQGTGS